MVDFRTGTLARAETRAFVIEDGVGGVRDAKGFAFGAEELREFGCKFRGFYGRKTRFFVRVERITRRSSKGQSLTKWKWNKSFTLFIAVFSRRIEFVNGEGSSNKVENAG